MATHHEVKGMVVDYVEWLNRLELELSDQAKLEAATKMALAHAILEASKGVTVKTPDPYDPVATIRVWKD